MLFYFINTSQHPETARDYTFVSKLKKRWMQTKAMMKQSSSSHQMKM